MRITTIQLFRLNSWLIKPYHWSFGALPFFDATVAKVVLDDGSEGYGESTPVTGYSWESPDDVWEFAQKEAKILCGQESDCAVANLDALRHEHPFGVTPLMAALETANGCCGALKEEKRFPLVGILNCPDERDIPDGLESLLAQGFTTIKYKIGKDVQSDVRKVRLIQALLNGRAVLRLDANQHYSFEDAVLFAKSVSPEQIELLEQPFAPDDWDSTKRFYPGCPFPLMLDESIYGEKEILRVATERCADWVKLKVVKSGGISALIHQIRMLHDNGIKVIVGNGAATDISCYHELRACIDEGVASAGEMNGYLKLRTPLLPQALGFADGHAVLYANVSPYPADDVLKQVSVSTAVEFA